LTDTGYKDVDVIDWTHDPSGTAEQLAINSELRDEMDRAIAIFPPGLKAAVVMVDI
jgi:DNA-directed RNA polymerase specialized sigma24 family protein